MTELSGYALSLLREGPFRLYRGLGERLAPILLVAAAEHGLPAELEGKSADDSPAAGRI